MLAEMIMEQVTDVAEQSEIDVLIAIGESYSKYLDILCYSDDVTLIQESYLFMEDGESSDNILTKIKNVFIKAVQYIKAAISKIVGFIKKKFIKYTAAVNTTYNIARIAAAIYDINPDTVVKESADVYVEALTPEEAERRKALHRAELKKQQVKKEIQSNNRATKEIYKGLKKNYAADINRRLLTNSEIKEIAKEVERNSTKEELIKFKKELESILNKEKDTFSKNLARNEAMINNMHDTFVGINKATQEASQQANVAKKVDKLGAEDVMMRLDLMEKFSKTMGSVLNDLGNTQAFTYENLVNDFYGEADVSGMLSRLSNRVKALSEKISPTQARMEAASRSSSDISSLLDSIGQHGADLYKAHKDFDDAVFADEMKRKELGMKANKSVKNILFALDQIKEESYGYTDDKLFNKLAYDSNNPLASILGGPFTMVFTLVKTIISGPAALALGPMDAAMYGTFRLGAHTTNQAHHHIVSDRDAYDAKPLFKPSRMQNAIKDLPYEEKMKVIRKSREDLQRINDEKELAEAKAKGR